MIGILCAVPEELAAVRVRLGVSDAPEVHGPTRVWRGQGLVLALAGIGKVNAAAAATLLLSAFGATRLIFSGVAGGLHPDLEVGAVLLADRLAIHDFGVISGGRFTATASGVIPIGAPPLTELPQAPESVASVLRQLAERVAPQLDHPVQLGGVVTADYFLNCDATRRDLRERFGADAIDMESGAVAQVADAWGAPLYVIRTLSDLAGGESHTTYPQMAAMAAGNSAVCVEALLEILSQAGVK
jgi:adenosylhomocysteine nucleosidase